jgi:hypothetical protein
MLHFPCPVDCRASSQPTAGASRIVIYGKVMLQARGKLTSIKSEALLLSWAP